MRKADHTFETQYYKITIKIWGSESTFCELRVKFGRSSDKTTKQEVGSKYVEGDGTSV